MWPIGTDVTCSVVCVSVCVCVLGTGVSCAKAGEPIEMPFGADPSGPKEPCKLLDGEPLLDEVEIPGGIGKSRGLSSLLKSIVSLCCGVPSKRDHSIVNNGMQQ